MRRLIINADDFGLTSGVNRAIVEAQGQGIVTSATLMAGANAFGEAAAIARSITAQEKAFSVGCHVVLLDGEPLCRPNRVPSLMQSGVNPDSRLRDSLNQFVIASFRHKLNPEEIEAETIAQMKRIQGAGVVVSHFDTHKHAHMFPAVLRPLLRAARARNVGQYATPLARCGRSPWLTWCARARLGNGWRS